MYHFPSACGVCVCFFSTYRYVHICVFIFFYTNTNLFDECWNSFPMLSSLLSALCALVWAYELSFVRCIVSLVLLLRLPLPLLFLLLL